MTVEQQRLALGVEYNGQRYHGWQAQASAHGPTIQMALEHALGRIADQPIPVQCGGRTDAGVHALGQVVHFDTTAERPERAWVLGTNTYLPDDVAVLWARPVAPEFNARFLATSRVYRYLILNRPAPPGLYHGRVGWHPRPLDVPAMAEAARYALGYQDFSAVRAAGCQARHPWREITAFAVQGRPPWIYVDVTANAFLHHMVRNLVGILLAVGRGEWEPASMARILASRDRRQAGVTAPAAGLYLVGIHYPAAYGLPPPATPPSAG